MLDPMYEQFIVWGGLAILFVLCLPISSFQRLVLELSAIVLRVGLIALLAAAVYLWFRPAELPVQVVDTLNNLPALRDILPPPRTPIFGVCATSLLVIPLLPVLAALDVGRKLAGWRLRRLRKLVWMSPAVEGTVTQTKQVVVEQPVNRRSAAAALAEATSRRPIAGVNRQ